MDMVPPVPREVDLELAGGGGEAEVLDEDVEELLRLVFRSIQAPFAEPGLLLEGGLPASGASLRDLSDALLPAGPTPPPVVVSLAGGVDVVGVYVEDKVGAEPPLPLHPRLRRRVVGGGIVDVGGGVLDEVAPKVSDVVEGDVAEHGPPFEREEAELPLPDSRWRPNLLSLRQVVASEPLRDVWDAPPALFRHGIFNSNSGNTLKTRLGAGSDCRGVP